MLVDIGLNLSNKRFDKDRQQVIARAQAAGVSQMILTGTCEHHSQQAAQLAADYPGVLYATAGVHPHDAKNVSAHYLDELRALAKLPQVVAIGECGLDFNRDFSPRPVQEKVFEEQLSLAAELQLPVFMHERDATDRQIAILKPWRDKLCAGVIHCFTGDAATLKAYLDLDLHIGITGWICDERRGQDLYQLLPQIPAERLMLETDAPYLLPRDMRPKPKSSRNEPSYLPHIAKAVARSRGDELESLLAQCQSNTRQFFGLGKDIF